MKIAFLDHTAKWSGGEIALYRTLKALRPLGVEPLVILGEEGAFQERLQQAGIPVLCSEIDSQAREVRKNSIGVRTLLNAPLIRRYLSEATKLARLIRQNRIELIHCNSLKSDIYGGITGRLAGKKVIWHVRDRISPDYLPRKVVTGFQTLARCIPSGIIANSQSTLGTVTRRTDRRHAVIYDGLGPEELAVAARAPYDTWSRVPRIGIVGRISKWKGQDIFIEAARTLLDRGLTADFELIGSAMFGEEAFLEQVRQQALPAAERIHFVGFSDQIFEKLQTLDILAHCSVIPEPFGQVIIEGMAVGIPVIASDGGGAREIITAPDRGILTPMGDAAALATALQTLLNEPAGASAMGRAGYRHVREQFRVEQSAGVMKQFFVDILG